MNKYHISSKTGKPEPCNASKIPCPLGGVEHFEANTASEVQEKFESFMKGKYGVTSSVQRDSVDQARKEFNDARDRTLKLKKDLENAKNSVVVYENEFLRADKTDLRMAKKNIRALNRDRRRTDPSKYPMIDEQIMLNEKVLETGLRPISRVSRERAELYYQKVREVDSLAKEVDDAVMSEALAWTELNNAETDEKISRRRDNV